MKQSDTTMTRYFIWFSVTSLLYTTVGQCPQNKYGPYCRYDCHCGQDVICGQTGCLGQCDLQGGWDGSTCQRQNVALKRPAQQSPAPYCESTVCHDANLVVDGQKGHNFYQTPCSQAGSTPILTSPAQWNVALDQEYDIYRFTIYNRGEGSCCKGRLNRFVLYVGQRSQPGYNYRECYRDSTQGGADSAGPGNVINGQCNNNMAVRGDIIQIRQTNSYPLTLCELLIYVCSPGWYGEECDRECVTTTNCVRCDADQLKCAECVSNKWGERCEQSCFCLNGAPCEKDTGRCPNDECASGYKGSSCQTPCTPGTYGFDCTGRCGDCAMGTTVCNITTGDCPDRSGQPTCMAGYQGTRCDQVCPGGRYGADCALSCGQCAQGQDKCDRYNGDCPRGQSPRCGPGWRGYKCVTECPPGFYDGDCTGRCGQCYGGRDQCDRVTGNCPDHQPSRCAPGWGGDRCQTACSAGSYGGDCQETCGQCRTGSDKCDRVTGVCPLGGEPRCSDGFTGDLCKTACGAGFYGTNCEQRCGNCVNGEPCANTDGTCTGCAAGWTTSRCTEVCTAGTWGENCRFNCSIFCLAGVTSCNSVNGSCAGGCLDGYTGERCEPDSLAAPDDSPVGSIVGAVVAVIVLAVIAVVVILFVLKRRRRKTPDPKAHFSPNEVTASSTAVLTEELPNDASPVSEDSPVVGNGAHSDYYNVVSFSADRGSGVDVKHLWEYIAQKKAAGGFKTEYEKLLSGLQAMHKVAKIPENKAKSRYVNILAYDHSRVILKTLDNDPNSTYINACYIHGYKEENKYIASQGPTPVIINDFMRMIWEQDSGKVVMLTNLNEEMKKKCDQYWPSSGSMELGLIGVTLLDEETYADFVIRTLQFTHVNEKGKTKIVKQFHFTSWPDHGVPLFATALLNFREKLLSAKSSLNGPMVVHCSAGVGRTGTFIGLDYLINQARVEGRVDVPDCVSLMRKQRVNMIQTSEQYEFLHEALVEALKLSECSVPTAEFQNRFNTWETKDPMTGKVPLEEQFKRLQEMSVALRSTDLKAALLPENKAKNRNDQILASDSCRPFLSTPVKGSNDYINAVFLPACKVKRAFVLTQMPLPNTVIDFWRLIYEQNISTLVMLNVLPRHKTEQSIGVYWPDDKQEFGPFVVETLEVDIREMCDVRTLQLFSRKEESRKYKVKQFQCTFWTDKTLSPAISDGILSVLEDVEHWQQQSQNGPILVHCMDGVTKSGLYCAASSVIERLKVDQEVNILQTVKQMRANRPQIITDLEQFRFLHRLVLAYLENFETYSNFK